MKKVAVILSGCGARDGSEIREALFSLLALAQNNIKYTCFSLDEKQNLVYNHYAEEEMPEERNILIESARLSRGKIKNIKFLNAEDFDGILFPGGYGASLNLCDFGKVKSENFTIHDEVKRVILHFKNLGKPLCFLCISSALAAKLIPNVEVTVGSDSELSSMFEKIGAKVSRVQTNIPVIDLSNKVVSCPCYLLNINIVELYEGISKSVQAFKGLSS